MNKKRATFCQTEQAMLSVGEQEKSFRFWHSPLINASRNSAASAHRYGWHRLSAWAQPAIPLIKIHWRVTSPALAVHSLHTWSQNTHQVMPVPTQTPVFLPAKSIGWQDREVTSATSLLCSRAGFPQSAAFCPVLQKDATSKQAWMLRRSFKSFCILCGHRGVAEAPALAARVMEREH